jgi:D-alanine transaminase
MIVYCNGEFMEKSKVVISPDDRGFLFADGVYEVIRAYQGRLFKRAEHFDRLAYGLKELRIGGVDLNSLAAIAARLLTDNGLAKADATVYLQITRGSAPRSHRFPPTGTPPTCYLEAKPFSPPTNVQQTGAAAITVPDQRWARCDIKTIALLANTLAHQQAHEAGAFEAIFARNGVLQEGSHSSILFVKDNVLISPPLTNHILAGITRSVVHSVAAAESISTATRSCHEDELPEFQEVLMVGTTVDIVPITVVNGRPIGGGAPGPIARKLQSALHKLTQPSPS